MCIKGCPVPIYQDEGELKKLLTQFKRLKPKRILEIGSLFGGTLWYWMQNAPGSTIVAVDLPVMSYDWRHKDVQAGRLLWPVWAKTCDVTLHVLDMDSTNPGTVARAAELGPYDFVFIDGDHRHPAAYLDFENYYPLVRAGGLCALHDIAYPEGNPDGYVTGRLWQEIVAKYPKTREIVRDEPGGIWGIGVVTATAEQAGEE